MNENLQRNQVLKWRRFVFCRGGFEYVFDTASGHWYGRGGNIKEALADAHPLSDEIVDKLWGRSQTKAKNAKA